MNLRISLHGALRAADPSGYVELAVPEDCTIGDLRELLAAFLATHAPPVSQGLVRRCAFATSNSILHDQQQVPAGVELAILPPVSGG